MFFKLFFRQWPLQRQIAYLVKNGVLIGSRTKDQRKIFIYMYNDFFAEVMYRQDDPSNEVEQGNIVKGLKNLNNYLENEFKTTF